MNLDELVPMINSTGLTFRWIQEMGSLTFQEQVDVMANTGILIAVHGAGLANVMFMPAHSVVIEVCLKRNRVCSENLLKLTHSIFVPCYHFAGISLRHVCFHVS